MNQVVNKELAGRSRSVTEMGSNSKSYRHGLISKWEPVMNNIGTGNIQLLCCDVDMGLSAPISKFVDTRLCRTVDMLEGRHTVQKDLGRTKSWGCVNLMKFNMARYKVLHLSCVNPKHKYGMGGE